MRLILSLFFFAALFIPISAQIPAKIKLQKSGLGKITVVRGKTRSVIDLSKDVAGCAYVTGGRKRELDKKSCAAPAASFKLLSAVVKTNQTFLVVQSEAMGNCNVCGQCGASEAYALIWIKLDARLRILDKKSTPIEYCLADVFNITPSIKVNEQNQNPRTNLPTQSLELKFNKDILVVEFEKTIFNENSEISGYEFSHLEYNRKTPEKGFVIKTEKRAKSSIE